MNIDNTGIGVVHTQEWNEGGPDGCLMSIVKVGAFTTVLAVTVIAAYYFGGPLIMDLWW